MMKQKLHPFEDIEEIWHQNPSELLVPDEIQAIFRQLHMTPTTYQELWKKRCLLGEGFAECFTSNEDRNWSIGSEGQNHIDTYAQTHLFVLKDLQDEEYFCDLANLFFQVLGGFITINLYWNQITSSRFPPHYDCHDVFAFQLYGRKNWKIASPTQKLSAQLDLNNAPSTYPEEICTNIDTGLYLPWGSWHHAEPLENSIHVSIGIHDHPFFPQKIPFS